MGGEIYLYKKHIPGICKHTERDKVVMEGDMGRIKKSRKFELRL